MSLIITSYCMYSVIVLNVNVKSSLSEPPSLCIIAHQAVYVVKPSTVWIMCPLDSKTNTVPLTFDQVFIGQWCNRFLLPFGTRVNWVTEPHYPVPTHTPSQPSRAQLLIMMFHPGFLK